jgi:hypothetical protein
MTAGSPTHNPQQRVVADGDHQSLRKTGRRPATKGKPEMMDNALQTRCPPRPLSDNAIVKAFGKNATSAPFHNAEEAARHDAQMYSSTRARQIRYLAQVAAVNAAGYRPTLRTPALNRSRSNRHHDSVGTLSESLDGEP